eukprot:scaffold9134_cov170-Amphora_coffeaeformis.AAC.14
MMLLRTLSLNAKHVSEVDEILSMNQSQNRGTHCCPFLTVTVGIGIVSAVARVLDLLETREVVRRLGHALSAAVISFTATAWRWTC